MREVWLQNWRAIFLALCFLVVFRAFESQAEVTSGWAFLAAEHRNFPSNRCAQFAEASPRPFLAVLADSFGRSKRCLRKFMRASKEKPTHFLYYLSNGAGRRKRLYSYEFLHRLSPEEYNQKLCSGDSATKRAVLRQARRLEKRCNRAAHSKARCYIALELESQFTECAAKRLVKWVQQAGWPYERIVHNPVNIGPYQGRGDNRIMLERHHVLSKAAKDYHLGIDGACADHCGPCGISGKRITDNEILQWLTAHKDRKDVFFSLWCPEHQGLFVDSGAAPEPRRRTIRVSEPSFKLGSSLIGAPIGGQQKPSRGHNLKRCKRVEEFGAGNVAKESDHGGFVAVIKDKLKRAQLVTPLGRRFKLRYTGTANPYQGRPRHHYRHRKEFYTFPNNMVLRGKEGRRTTCYKLYQAGSRHG